MGFLSQKERPNKKEEAQNLARSPFPIFLSLLPPGGGVSFSSSSAMAALPPLLFFPGAGNAAMATSASPGISAICPRHALQRGRRHSVSMSNLLAPRLGLLPSLPPLRCARSPQPPHALRSSLPLDALARAPSSGSCRPDFEDGEVGGGEDERAYDGGGAGGGGDKGRKGGGNGGGFRGWWGSFDQDGWRGRRRQWWSGEANWASLWLGNGAVAVLLPLLCLCCLAPSQLSPSALARSTEGDGTSAWEVRGGKWTRLAPDPSGEGFVVAGGGGKEGEVSGDGVGKVFVPFGWVGVCWRQLQGVVVRLMLPEGYPESVTSDYMEYSIWRGIQGIASQVSGVLSTQALLYAVGLGKGAIPTAAAINWVLKDGIGYLSKIMLSKYGRHFDVNPKGWRLFADLLENAAYGMEILTPAFPHLFVMIGAAAGASRSASALIQAATRSCFYAGFAAQRNFAEVIAKGEAQGMVSKFLGIMLGIAIANLIGSSTPLALATFGVVTGVHMYCNLKSYRSIQLRTLNPYRASLVFSEYLLSGQVPAIKEVNDEEPIFPYLPIKLKPNHDEQSNILSVEAKDAALQIVRRLHLGLRLSGLVKKREDALALFDLFRSENYMLVEEQGNFCVSEQCKIVLKEDSTPEDMLKSLFHVNYLYWLEKNLGFEPRNIIDECKHGGRLQISLDYVQREFSHIKRDGQQHGWATDGLIARPLPNRIQVVEVASCQASSSGSLSSK
ncbi:hypothetical protein Taro_030728 [Colocasia esculenta]|uniref:Protein root UVB sensitive/RUS domain-containing protein n=1 Tax=Colocasia esculenta TaxID=4460 RepID=A0A843W108_COLES|nr:hypothetical protein [Colocasia esculenta]